MLLLVNLLAVTHVADLLLRPPQPLHLRGVGHHAEAFPSVLLKVFLVKSLRHHSTTISSVCYWLVFFSDKYKLKNHKTEVAINLFITKNEPHA